MLFLPRLAYAAPSIEVNGNFAGYENGETYKGYIVVDAPNEYIATLTLIGEYSSLVQIDSDMYAKLSNESSGGRFYELVQQWEKLGTPANGSTQNYVDWGGSEDFQLGLTVVYGYGRVWECVCTDSLKSGAKEDFLTILGGGSLGGGSSGLNGEVVGNYVYFDFNNIIDESNLNGYSGVRIKKTDYEWMQSHEGYYLYAALGKRNNSGTYKYTFAYIGDQESALNVNNRPVMPAGTKYCGSYSSEFGSVTYNSKKYMNVDSTLNGNISTNTNTLNSSIYPVSAYYWGGGGSGGDEPGDNNWPEDDTPAPPSENPPTPPTINPPSSPNPPTISPHNPTYPTPPTNEPAPTGTSPIDYTPWLEAILQQLVNLTSYLETCFTWLGTALDEHCQHIRDHMTTCSTYLGDYVVGGMSTLLGEHHTFLNGLAKWIVDNLKWENSGGEFDDSNMIYWLRRIYARQGTGDVNTRPVDPAISYGSFAGWLGVLYDEIALDVSDTSLVALSASLSGLQHTFPFSLPWDIKQVLQALDVSPVTPSASIPTGTRGVTYDFDLHFLDSVMVSVRALELLIFVVYVMVHTKDLFGYLMGE